jgi:ATP-dependent Clp protease ATP-binding subunit ClpA
MFERFAPSTRAAFGYAVRSAAARGDRRVGTEHLLLGLLSDPAAGTATLLRTDLPAALAQLHAMDEDALAAVGIDTGRVQLAPTPAPAGSPARVGRVQLTAAAKDAIIRTQRIAAAGRAPKMEPEHLLLALLELARPDPAAQLFARLGVDTAAVRQRLAGAA